MSEEAFDRIEQHLNRLQTEVRTGLADVQSKIGDVDRHMHVLHEKAMDAIGDVKHRMHVLHEDAMGAIRGIAEHRLVTEPELNRRLAAMQEPIDRRLDELEAAIRRKSREHP